MRSARAGGLIVLKSREVKLRSVDRKDIWTEDVETILAIHRARGHLMMKRANEYAAPTHNARTIKANSVSFPVWIV